MKQEVKDKIAAKFNFFLSGDNPYTSTAAFCQVAAEFGYNLAQEEYAAQSTQEGGTVEAAKEYAKDFYNSNHALDGMPKSIIDDAHRLAALHFSKGCEYSAHLSAKKIKKLEDELDRFGEVAESKIEELENACEEYSKEGRKMAEDADAKVAELEKEVERLGIMLVKAMGEVNDRDLEVERLRGLVELVEFDEGYSKGYSDAQKEAAREIQEHYHPNK